MSDGFVRPVTAQAAVLAELRQRIGTGQLQAGAPIRQDRLAEELGVSRHPVREALRVLEGEGQIVHEAHRGYYVAELRRDALLEIYRMRDLLESEALRTTVPHADAALVGQMQQMVDLMQAISPLEDMAAFVRANRAFHFAPFAAAAMPRLLHHIEMLWAASDAYRTLYYMQGDNLAHVHLEHRDFLDAVERRDVDNAVRISRAHRDGTVQRLAPLLGSARS